MLFALWHGSVWFYIFALFVAIFASFSGLFPSFSASPPPPPPFLPMAWNSFFCSQCRDSSLLCLWNHIFTAKIFGAVESTTDPPTPFGTATLHPRQPVLFFNSLCFPPGIEHWWNAGELSVLFCGWYIVSRQWYYTPVLLMCLGLATYTEESKIASSISNDTGISRWYGTAWDSLNITTLTERELLFRTRHNLLVEISVAYLGCQSGIRSYRQSLFHMAQ